MDSTIEDRLGRMPDPFDQAESAYYRRINTRRLLAWIIDSILIMVLSTVLVPFTAFTALFALPAFFFLVGFVYRTLTLASGSATWGMAIMGMELRHDDGTRFTLQTAALHTLLYSAAMAIFPLQLISVILMLTSGRKQGLHDMILAAGPIRARA